MFWALRVFWGLRVFLGSEGVLGLWRSFDMPDICAFFNCL